MKLYPKKLRNVDELEKERGKLLRRQRAIEKDGLSGASDIFSRGAKSEKGGEDAGWESILESVQGGNPMAGMLMKVGRIIVSRIRRSAKDKKTADAPYAEGKGGEGPSVAKKIAIEFIGGYLKWKALELSFRLVKHLIKSRKEAE